MLVLRWGGVGGHGGGLGLERLLRVYVCFSIYAPGGMSCLSRITR